MERFASVGDMTLVRRSTLPLAALALALALAGCAPAAIGTSPAAPYPVKSSSIQTTPGKTVYVEAHYTFADFGIDATKLTGTMWVPSGYNSSTAVLNATFSLKQVQVPAGWSLQLVQVQATRTTVEGPKSFSKSTLDYTLTVLLSATAKPRAVAGPYHLRAMLDYQKTTQPIHIDLRVR